MVERVLGLSTGSLVGRAVSQGLWLQGLGITKLVSATGGWDCVLGLLDEGPKECQKWCRPAGGQD